MLILLIPYISERRLLTYLHCFTLLVITQSSNLNPALLVNFITTFRKKKLAWFG